MCLVAIVVSAAETNTNLQTAFPAPSGTTELSSVRTIAAGESFDGEMLQWERNPSTCSGQSEGGDADAIFILESGAILSNAVIGPSVGEGVHCLGPCTLNNVWWPSVCEDAATFKQAGDGDTSFVSGGGARDADDKVLQHNGAGTVVVRNFFAQDVGKVYRSCGNCEAQEARASRFEGLRVEGAGTVAGVNGNLGDTTVIENSCILDSRVCDLFEGNDDGSEPTKTATAPDGVVCETSNVSTSGC
ncbi:pectate lyase [Lineolata rhizophorae]|uniref:Pectate lyase n=1 Tax=Lineolata rhizophorae TaxID=578093 RepID=A0A6A6NW51_9PEZI|nr:pectate lyase [Lineolata rhizophorae]